MNKYLKYAIALVVKPILAEEIRVKGLQALKGYLQTIAIVRMGAMGAVGGISALALLVCGFVLFIGGLLSVLGVSGVALSWIALVVGAILTIAAIVGFFFAFNERRWLEYSKSYELINALCEPVPSPQDVPKNVMAAFKGEPVAHVPRSEIQPHYNPPYERKNRIEIQNPEPVF